MLPDFIGIGAPKAGTTWLFKCLQEHPEVFVASVKETSFFDFSDVEGRINKYEEHFASSEQYRARGEVSTRYLASEKAPARVKRYIPDARLFVSLRNPIDQVYSHYWHLARQNFHQRDGAANPRTFEEALEEHGERLLRPALYHEHLTRWLSLFEREQVLILFYDDIRASPAEVLKTVFSFIGVDERYIPRSLMQTGSSVRQGISPRSPTLGRVHTQVYSQLNSRVYRPLKRVVGTRTADRIKDALRVRPIMEFLFHRKGYPRMRADTRAMLRRRFDEDLKLLSTMAGRDLSHWV